MPVWFKKRLQKLKKDLLNHLVAKKSSQQILSSNNNNKNNTNLIKPSIQKIRNDLKSNEYCNKSDMNAYRDYAKWRDRVLIEQNNCAIRCASKENNINYKDEKTLNHDVSNTSEDIVEKKNRLDDFDCINEPALPYVDISDKICDSKSGFAFCTLLISLDQLEKIDLISLNYFPVLVKLYFRFFFFA